MPPLDRNVARHRKRGPGISCCMVRFRESAHLDRLCTTVHNELLLVVAIVQQENYLDLTVLVDEHHSMLELLSAAQPSACVVILMEHLDQVRAPVLGARVRDRRRGREWRSISDSTGCRRHTRSKTMMDPVIISVAVTGGEHGREKTPHLPITPEETVVSAVEAHYAGASIAHIHARDSQVNHVMI
jgi:hypothetical protein